MSQENSELVHSFVWKIENFSLWNHIIGAYITSPNFIVETLSHSKWYLKFYPKFKDSEDQEYFKIFLYRNDQKSDKILIDFKIKVFNSVGITVESSYKNKIFSEGGNWGWHRFCKCDEFTNVVNNWKENSLTVLCEISSKQPNSTSVVSRCEARSRIGINRCSFDLNFNLNNSPDCKDSKQFSCLDVPIEVAVSVPNDEIEITIFLVKNNLAKSKTILCQLSLLDEKGKKVLSKCDTHRFNLGSDVWKFPSFFTKKQLEDAENLLFRENILTLWFDICIANDTVTSEIEHYTPYLLHSKGLKFVGLQSFISDSKALTSLQDDMHAMYSLRKHCDVELQANNRSIPAHRALLAARSPVFSVMFDQDMLENQTGIVVIQDVKVDTLNSLLEFIYTGSLQELDYERASDLLIAADKYQISSLKETCSDFLTSNLSILNVCDVLTEADMIGYIPLKACAMNYMMDYHEQVMSSEKWPEWVRDNNVLATEVLLKLTNFFNKGKKK